MNAGFRRVVAARRAAYRISDAQTALLRRLAREAFAALMDSGVDEHHLDKLTKAEASAAIDRLIALKRAGWRQGAS